MKLKTEQEIQKLKEANKVLREAAAFYGNPNNYSLTTHLRPRVKVCQRILSEKDCDHVSGWIYECGGKLARESLAKADEIMREKKC